MRLCVLIVTSVDAQMHMHAYAVAASQPLHGNASEYPVIQILIASRLCNTDLQHNHAFDYELAVYM